MINKITIDRVLSEALSTGGDFAEIFVEDTSRQTIRLLDGKVDDMSGGRSFGVGIRIFKGYHSVYGYSNDHSEERLLITAKNAAIALGATRGAQAWQGHVVERIVANHFPIAIVPAHVPAKQKIEWLKDVHRAAKDDAVISQVSVNYLDIDQRVMIANSDGLLTHDRRVRTRVAAQSVASSETENQVGYTAPGRHMGFELLKDHLDAAAMGREASRIAKTMLRAEYAPAGQMPVVIDNAFGGVIFHEACGHSLEATSVAKGTSEFTGKLGQQIASPILTAIDDGTIASAWGSQNIDDEGMPTRKNVLIENGILKNYLIDHLNSRRMKMATTGSARRESYKYEPTSRMTNTYIAAGNDSFDTIIRSVDNGFYAKRLGGGSVNPATGEFNFAVQEGYLIEKGEIKAPLRGASLIGVGSQIIKKVDMISDNLDYAAGMCGSLSGSVPVFVGQPTIRVSSMLVGGK